MADGPTRSYRPGDWYAVVSDDLVVLLPASARSEAATVWAEVEGGADAETVLDRLLSEGLRRLEGLVLLDTTGEGCRALVRGAARCHLEGGGEVLDLDGSSVRTWVEGGLDRLERLWVELGPNEGADDGADLLDWPIGRGLVPVSRLDQPSQAGASGPAEPEVVETGPDTEPDAGPEESWADPEPWPDPEPDPDPDSGEDTGERELLTEPISLPEAPLPSLVPGFDDDEEPESSAPPGAVALLRFSHGEEVLVDGPIVVGRSPDVSRASGPEEARAVKVPSPQQEISSSHLEIRPGTGIDSGVAVVLDLGSTNGTVVAAPDLAPETLLPGVLAALLPGSVIDLGDGLTITVDQP